MEAESQVTANQDEKSGIFNKANEQGKRFWERNKKTLSMWGYVTEGIFGVIFGIVWLILINVFYDDLEFLTEDFDLVLFAINVSAVVGILLNFLLVILHTDWYRALSKIIQNIFSFGVTLTMLIVSPFDFTGKWDFFDTLLPILLVVFLVAIVIGIITDSIKLVKAIFTD